MAPHDGAKRLGRIYLFSECILVAVKAKGGRRSFARRAAAMTSALRRRPSARFDEIARLPWSEVSLISPPTEEEAAMRPHDAAAGSREPCSMVILVAPPRSGVSPTSLVCERSEALPGGVSLARLVGRVREEHMAHDA